MSNLSSLDMYCPLIKSECRLSTCRFFRKGVECIIVEYMMTGIERNVNWK